MENIIKRVPKFLGEVKAELGKVSWSTREELKGATSVVIAMTTLIAAYIGIVDLILSRFLAWMLK